jgi:putative transposase
MHVVFVTMYRRGVLDADALRSYQDAMRKVRRDFAADPQEFNGDYDHLHLLL